MNLRGIIREMASIRNMRDLVVLVKTTNDRALEDFKKTPKYEEYGITENRLHTLWMLKEEAITFYGAKIKDNQKARDVYGDATSKKYGYLREDKVLNPKQVADTSAGRELLEKGWLGFPKGIFKAWIEVNHMLTNLLWIVIGAIVGGIVGNIGSIIDVMHRHLPLL